MTGCSAGKRRHYEPSSEKWRCVSRPRLWYGEKQSEQHVFYEKENTYRKEERHDPVRLNQRVGYPL